MLDRETRKLIMKIVGNAKNEILGEIHKISDRQLRTIVKTIRTCTTSEEDQNGPLNQVRRDQVNAVRRILFDAYQHRKSTLSTRPSSRASRSSTTPFQLSLCI